MNKVTKVLLVIITLVVLMTGCANQTSNKKIIEDGITVVDSLGHEVIVPKNITKVACFYPLASHVTTMLNKDIQIVAGSNGIKKDILLSKINASLETAVSAGSGRNINIETLINTDPDLAIVGENMLVNEGEIDKLENSHIPYVIMKYGNMKEQQDVISMLGKALGKEEKAEKYNEFYNKNINLVNERVKDFSEDLKPRVFYSTSEATRTEPSGTIVSDWINTVGLVNVADQGKLELVDGMKTYANLEQIYIWNPDAFIVSEESAIKYIKTTRSLEALKAVKNNAVYQLPLGVSRWGHPSSIEIPLTLIWAGQTFYPDEFNDIDLKSEIKNFYKDFFEYELDDSDIEQILLGVGMRGSNI